MFLFRSFPKIDAQSDDVIRDVRLHKNVNINPSSSIEQVQSPKTIERNTRRAFESFAKSEIFPWKDLALP